MQHEDAKLGGVPRSFPTSMLVGAECILARVHYEHSVSKRYTPLVLGELISKRSFTGTGEVNMLSTKKSKAKLALSEEDGIEAAESETWEPLPL